MKIAICFFGLTRSLKSTISSIKLHLIKPLIDNGYTVDIYMHTFQLDFLTNNRSNEINCKLDNLEYKLLEPFRGLKIDNQNEIDKKIDFNAYRLKGDPWKDKFKSLNNLLRQHYSLEQVTKLWEINKNEYSAVIYARPDVKFIKNIDINCIKNLNENTILVPSFLPCKGCNDRFAIGKPDVMLIYGKRKDFSLEYSQNKPLHAESFLKNILLNNNINIELIHFPFYRVRANGVISELDKKHAK